MSDVHIQQSPSELSAEYLTEVLADELGGGRVVSVRSEPVATDDGMVALLHRVHLELADAPDTAARSVIAEVPNEVGEGSRTGVGR